MIMCNHEILNAFLSFYYYCSKEVAGEIHIIHTILSLSLYMHYQILKEPMSMLEIQLNKEEEITAEAGALVYIKGNVEVKTATRTGGGLL